MRVGIVLSGGASKCIAHLGVLKALFEMGIQPEMMAASSGGALFGSYVAAGLSPDDALHIIMINGMTNIFKPSNTVKGLFSSERIESVYRNTLPVKRFEELKIPMLVPATDILMGNTVVFSSGDIIKPVIASSSYPAIFEPVEIEGHKLLDGGIMNNFPVDLIKDRCDTIIGVSVGKLYPLKEIKTLRKFFFRSLELSIIQSDMAKRDDVDILLEPPGLDRYDKFDISKGHEIFTKGYRYTLNFYKSL